MELTLQQMLGQKLVFGFHGTTLPENFRELLRKYKIGNVALFLRNVESAEQVRTLVAEIQTLILQETGIPAFIAIDQEGGMVSRLSADAVNVPCAMALAATGDVDCARRASEITIRQLRGIGANFNMAPVVDVNSNPKNPVIGIRSFGDDARRVAELGLASIAPYADSGVLCCLKHFPGHGDTAVDSHLGLPRVDKTLEELEAIDLIPFRAAIDAGAPAVMISHVLYSKLDPEMPSTMSRRIVTDLLKDSLGFDGLVLSDCMEMGAIQETYGTAEGVVAAIQAGTDLVGVSSSFELECRTAERVQKAAENGELDMDELRASVEKILRFKQQLIPEPEAALCNLEADRNAAQAMHRQALSHISGSPFRANEKTFFCGCADYRVSLVANEDGSAAAFPQYMGSAFSAASLVTAKDPDEAEIARAAAQAADCGSIVLGTCNAHLFRGQLKLAEALAALGKPMAVVALRNPYDLPEVPDSAWKLAAYDYCIPAFRAVEEILRGGEAVGRCPVQLGGSL